MKHSLTAAQLKAMNGAKLRTAKKLKSMAQKAWTEKEKKRKKSTPDSRAKEISEDLEGLTEGERKLNEL